MNYAVHRMSSLADGHGIQCAALWREGGGGKGGINIWEVQ
jgi:hypothetical protein